MGDIGRIAFWRLGTALSAAAALLAAAVLLAGSQALPEVPIPGPGGQGSGVDAERAYADLPLSFEPNRSRVDRGVDFLARTSAGTAYLTDRGARLVLSEGHADAGQPVDLRLLGARAAGPRALERLPGSVNDLRGDDRSKWETGIPTYERIRYSGIYPGVDLDWHGNSQMLEYDFRIAPGAEPEGIALRVDGADRLSLAPDGDLLIEIGDRTLRQAAPVAYQPDGGATGRAPVPARFELRGETVRFGLGTYDRGRPLVIDPIVLDYSTYLGGNGADRANAVAVDSSGAAYLTGRTLSTDFDTSGPVEGDAPQSDVFATKLNPAGDAVAYSTYVGGSWHDYGAGIAVDSLGAAYVTGGTRSTDFNTVGGIPQPSFTDDGAGMDVFVFKLTPSGNGLAYSTYLRATPESANCNCTREKTASSAEAGASIAVDAAGSAYITGGSEASFPLEGQIEGNTFEKEHYPGEPPGRTGHPSDESFDAFVSKLAPDGGSLVYSTMLGGSANDGGTGIAVDSTGVAYISGSTSSPDFDTVNPIEFHNHLYEADGSSGGYDAFVAKIDPGQAGRDGLVYSTYLGGNDFDAASEIAIDSSGAAYIAGTTQSTDFDTVAPVEGDSPGPDAFVSKLTPAGDDLAYSTYLGGVRADRANAIAVEPGGAAFVAGETDSRDFDFAGELEGDSRGADAFVTKLGAGGGLACSTLLGGDGDDSANGVATRAGDVYVAGETGSTDFDRVGGIEGDSPDQESDAFAAKLDFGGPCPDSPEGPAGPPPAKDLRVFVVVLDGLRPHEITPELTPKLYDLKEGGTWYQQARSVFIAETLPNHTAMLTGVLPERSGIVSNDYYVGHSGFDPRPRFGQPGLLEAPTLPTRLEESCDVSTSQVQSKEYLWHLLSGEAPDPSDPENQRLPDYDWSPVSSSAFIPDPDGHTPDASVMANGFMPWLDLDPPTPQFAFLNLGDIDRSGHIDETGIEAPGGLSAARQAGLSDTDAQIGMLRDKLHDIGAWDESVLIFTSDHGFDWGPQSNDMAIQTSMSGVPGVKTSITNGAAAMVYLQPGTNPEPIAQTIRDRPGVEMVATRQPIAGFPTLAQMGLEHPNAGDIIAFAEPHYAERADLNYIPGNHGHPVTQHQTLFVTGGHPALDEAPEEVGGQTVRDLNDHAFLPPAGGPGNLSIAPTVAALFGLGEPEGGYDGQPLTEAFDPWALEPHVPCGAANPPPTVSIDDVTLSEGNSGQRNATFTVSLSAPSLSEIRVDYRTNDGTALGPGDYESRAPTTLTFDPGDTEKQINIPVKGDTADEPNETFTVDLSAPVNAELAKLSGTATILDDDGPPDTDGDLVPDGLDSCPTLAGPAVNSGCPQTPAAAGAPESCRTETLGTAANDTLTGTTGPDLFRGLLGDDRLSGLDGPDCLFGGPGNDSLTGEGGNDLLRGGDGRDLVSGGPEPDVISGGRGNDRISGGAGDDQIRAADNGRDRVRCGPGHDEVIANPDDRVAASCELVGRAD